MGAMHTVPDLLAEFGPEGLTRDILRTWLEKKWVVGQTAGDGSKARRSFSPREVERIRELLRCYAAGFSPEAAYRIAVRESVPVELIPPEKLQHLIQIV